MHRFGGAISLGGRGGHLGLFDDPVQFGDLVAGQRPVGPGRHIAQSQRSDGDPSQRHHFVAQSGQDPPDLAVLAFAEDDLEFGDFRSSFDQLDPLDFDQPLGDVDAFTHLTHGFRINFAGHHDSVNLANLIFRVRQTLGQFAIVGHQDQPFAAAVEPADRKNAFGRRDQIDHPRSALGIAIGGHHADGFVDGKVNQSLRPQQRSVDFDFVVVRVDGGAQF